MVIGKRSRACAIKYILSCPAQSLSSAMEARAVGDPSTTCLFSPADRLRRLTSRLRLARVYILRLAGELVRHIFRLPNIRREFLLKCRFVHLGQLILHRLSSHCLGNVLADGAKRLDGR
jgi:hypothetical protein